MTTAAFLPRFSARFTAVALVALVAASALGYWAYGEYRKRELQAAVVALVTETSRQLRDALTADAAPTSDPQGAASRLEAQAGEIGQGLEALRRMNPAPNRPLVDAAELYVVTSRELLRRMAASKRSRVELAASTSALRALVHDTGRRSGAWIGEMLRANERLDKAYFNYRVAGEALAGLFDSLRRARANLAPRVDPALLLDETLRANAEARALAAAKRASEELGEVRRLASRN